MKYLSQSAGILLFKKCGDGLEFFLVHPGGPFWKNKDEGAWSIPKGEFNESESAFEAAVREFKEETGRMLTGDFIALTPIRQKSVKQVYAWAVEGDINEAEVFSNSFEMEWPPKSGIFKSFPEVDKAEWFAVEMVKRKINKAQTALIDEVLKRFL